ncbi:MEDS domain-containing protein [Actinomadura sp. NEAU-AAG7]|uniref:MEDS domain-containing protein n=1 Tax=Actinomadura sp. NEAU-AAG7 TaxID=2839640 RepID=UPI001BE49A73|nr:MEDS domain-containing protein [Actinomadura sp. NEAU-AAG7]MBT2209185.1 STAS domain-containing protein [Actinomadura sp. NEAU-AAG7]
MAHPEQSRTAVGAMLPGDHACLAYDHPAERDAIMTAFVWDGLRAGDAVLYLAEAGPDTAKRRLRAVFGADDRIEVLPACGDPRAAVRSALRRGYAGARLTVEASAAPRGRPGTARFAAFEDAVDRLVGAHRPRVTALCQYDLRWFDAGRLPALEERHGARVRADDVFDDGVLTIAPLFAPPGLRLSGVLDASTLPALVAALRDLDEGAAHLCLDLSRLDFCDLEGVRALVEANRSTAVLDRQIILRATPGCVELMLRVSGWRDSPGIVLEATG